VKLEAKQVGMIRATPACMYICHTLSVAPWQIDAPFALPSGIDECDLQCFTLAGSNPGQGMFEQCVLPLV